MKNRFTLLIAFCLMAMTSFGQLVDVATGFNFPIDMALYGNDLYVTEGGAAKLSKIDITQPMPTVSTELSGLSAIAGLYLDGNILYTAQITSGIVSKVDLTQSPLVAEQVVDLTTEAIDLIIIGDEMFITTGDSGSVVKIDLTQANPTATTVATGMGFPSGIINKGNVLYIAEFTGDIVSKIDLDAATPSPELVVSGLNEVAGVTINGNFLYIAHTSNVSRVDVTQTSPTLENVVTGLNGARLATFDGLDMYIAESGAGKISKLEIALPTFSALGTICSNAVPTDLGGASPTGGSYSGPGVTDDGNGETFTFDPAAAGGVGTYTITYTAVNGNMVTSTLEVVAAPTVTFTPPATVLIDAGAQALSGMPAGGTFSGPGVTDASFDPMAAGLGMHTITYTFTDGNGCSGTATGTITVNPNLPADNGCAGANDISALFGAIGETNTSGLWDNTGYTSDGDPTDGYACWAETGLQNTIWYTFMGTGDMFRIRSIECSATDYNNDTQVAIYSGSCGSLTPVACNDDEDEGAQIYNFQVDVMTEAGVEYRMMVDGYDGTDGEFCLEVANLSVSSTININETNIQVFPNPTTGEVRFNNVDADQVEVFDNMGRLLMSVEQPGNSIDISNAPAGMYFLKITEGENAYSTRVIKE